MQIGLYVHIPFCASKCFYCDFLSFPGQEHMEKYVKALEQEIVSTKESLASDTRVKSIFIGGGTPTVLPPFLLERVIKAVTNHFTLEEDAEWTIEANPGTINEEKIKIISGSPINRISLGLQSTHDHLLKGIGRIHTFKDWQESIRLIKRYTNCMVNSDLMFALPGQTMEEWKETLETVTAYDLEHLSVYALILEEGTYFWQLYEKGLLKEVDETLDRDMYHLTQSFLKERGYEQYEISNWAKPGKACVHNKVYWKLEPYIGVGLGAHGMMNGRRYYNEQKLVNYMAAAGDLKKLRYEEEEMTKQNMMEEYMFLGLRLLEGVSLEAFETHFKVPLWKVYGEVIEKWIKYGVMAQDKERNSVSLTAYGLDVCNEVFASFLQS